MAKDIVVRVGEYTDREGKVKGEWVKVGVIMSHDNGEYLMLDPKVNLAGVLTQQNMYAHEKIKAGDQKARTGKMVMCSIFDREQQSSGQGQSNQQTPPSGGDFDSDDIPF